MLRFLLEWAVMFVALYLAMGVAVLLGCGARDWLTTFDRAWLRRTGRLPGGGWRAVAIGVALVRWPVAYWRLAR